jgi:LuxR family transcriptional regulator, quorum-sensing system regulator BjaR1
MSASGTWRTLISTLGMSALWGKADTGRGALMTVAAQTFRQEVFEFIEDLDHQSDPNAVMTVISRVVARFGFEGLFVSWLRASPSQPYDDLVLAAQCPCEFRAVYASRGYVRFDPNVQRALSSARPFEWSLSACESQESQEHRVREVMRFLADFGFKRGFVVPIHNADGFEAGVGMVGDKLDFPPEIKPGLHLMALYALAGASTDHNPKPRKCRRSQSVSAKCSPGRRKESRLGKSVRYCNSPKGLLRSMRRAPCRKLGASNRTHAVAIAIRHRLFEF